LSPSSDENCKKKLTSKCYLSLARVYQTNNYFNLYFSVVGKNVRNKIFVFGSSFGKDFKVVPMGSFNKKLFSSFSCDVNCYFWLKFRITPGLVKALT